MNYYLYVLCNKLDDAIASSSMFIDTKKVRFIHTKKVRFIHTLSKMSNYAYLYHYVKRMPVKDVINFAQENKSIILWRYSIEWTQKNIDPSNKEDIGYLLMKIKTMKYESLLYL